MPLANPYFPCQKDPGLAGTLSLFLPGLGQIYNGETRKGILFVGVSIINLLLFLELALSSQLLNCLTSFGKAFHLVPNRALVESLMQLRFTSPPVLLASGFFIAFVIYASKDAYESIRKKRQPIYADSVLTMPEATSGSYLAHCALLTDCFLFALFFLIPAHPPREVPTITFVTNPSPNFKNSATTKNSEKPSVMAGPHVNKPPIISSSGARSNQSAKPVVPPHAMAQPKMQRGEQPSKSTPVKTASQPRPMLRTLAQSAPPLPNPMTSSHAAPGTPQQLVALAPAPKQSIMKAAPPAPFFIRTNIANMAGPMPTRTNTRSGIPMPQPMSNSGNAGHGSQSAPGPIPIDPGVGKGPLSTSPIPTGGPGSNHPGQSSNQPQPNRAPGPGGSPIALAPITGTSLPPGLHGGNPHSGEPRPFNSEKNGFPKLPPSDDGKPVDFAEYMADLQRRIRRAWFPPHRKESRLVVLVIFKIHVNGEMSNLSLKQSSGIAEADQAAMKAVENAAPFRPLPAGQHTDVDIQFTFDYTVFSGTGVLRHY